MVFHPFGRGAQRLSASVRANRFGIEAISDRSVPIIYASDLAEQAIKYEITQTDDNVFKKGFVVDVNLESRNGRLAAYRIMSLYQVIDLDRMTTERLGRLAGSW